MKLDDVLEIIPADQYITIQTQSFTERPIYSGEKLEACEEEYWEDIYPYLERDVYSIQVGLFGHLQITLDCYR